MGNSSEDKAAAEAWRGARDVAPLALGAAVYGLAFGVLAANSGIAVPEVGAMGALVFAGSSQIVAVERLATGAGAGAAILAGLALNLRLLLMTASLRDVLAGRPWWQVALGVHMTTDENWAVLQARRAAGERAGYWYLVGGGLFLCIGWGLATMGGAWVSGTIPDRRALGLDFAFTAAFIAVLRAMWRGRESLLPWLVSAGVVVVLTKAAGMDATWALILGGVGGAVLAGMRGDG